MKVCRVRVSLKLANDGASVIVHGRAFQTCVVIVDIFCCSSVYIVPVVNVQADASLEMERKHFYQESMKYVLLLQAVQERKKFEFVEIVGNLATVCRLSLLIIGTVRSDCECLCCCRCNSMVVSH